jgi:hypothetical protein
MPLVLTYLWPSGGMDATARVHRGDCRSGGVADRGAGAAAKGGALAHTANSVTFTGHGQRVCSPRPKNICRRIVGRHLRQHRVAG